jgi:hypothetical protein
LKTINFKIIKYDKNFDEYIEQSTGLFYKLYNNQFLIKNNLKLKELINKEFWLLNDLYVIRSIISDVETKIEQHKIEIVNKQKQIKEIEKELNGDDLHPKRRYNLLNKLAELKRNINKNICFGSKEKLRLITKLKQEIQFKGLINKQEILDKTLNEYKTNRQLGFYVIGSSLDNGNRKFNFDLLNNKIIFKPSKEYHSEIIINQIKSNKTNISISFDEELLNNYSFNSKEYKKEKIKLIKEDKGRIHLLNIKYVKEQEERKLKDKIRNRYLAVDLNPEEISIVIVDKLNNNLLNKIEDNQIIYKNFYNLKELNNKLKLGSVDKKQIKQNNKRKHEIKEIWSDIFRIANHYKVAYFVIEDLNIKNKSKGKEFNKKINNLWNRTLTTQLITKNCNEQGIILIEVVAAYSSFIGNLVYQDYDCIAATKEICRRGMYKYTKGNSIFPSTKTIHQEKLIYLLGEKVEIEGCSWKQLYSKLPSGFSYRNKDKSLFLEKYLKSNKSKVSNVLCFL